jgi:AraC-like DNA-binding protein
VGQLFALDTGSAVVKLRDSPWLILPGRVAWIPPSENLSITSSGDISGWSLALPANHATALPDRALTFKRSILVEQIVARVAHRVRNASDPASLRRLLAVLADEMDGSEPNVWELPLPCDLRLLRLTQMLSRNLNVHQDLNFWAREIGMSRRSLTRIFHAETGMSIGRWIQRLRMHYATEKLAAGADVTSVAVDCGYNSTNAFIRTFHLFTGMTPARYRRSTRTLRQAVEQIPKHSPRDKAMKSRNRYSLSLSPDPENRLLGARDDCTSRTQRIVSKTTSYVRLTHSSKGP